MGQARPPMQLPSVTARSLAMRNEAGRTDDLAHAVGAVLDAEAARVKAKRIMAIGFLLWLALLCGRVFLDP